MAQIPVGDSGNALLQPQRMPMGQAPVQALEVAHELGQTGQRLAGEVISRQQQEQEQLQRTRAANDLLDRQLVVKQQVEAIRQQVQTGQLPYAQAQASYAAALKALPPLQAGGLSADVAENLQRGVARVHAEGGADVLALVNTAQRADFQGQGVQMLDKLGKLAELPDANVELINAQVAALRPTLEKAGLDTAQVDKTLQDAQDRNWYSHARQQAVQAWDDKPALQQLEQDLTAKDGFFMGRLDADKRNAILDFVRSRQSVLQNRFQQQQALHNAETGQWLAQAATQVQGGTALSPEAWLAGAKLAKGTPYEAVYQDLRGSQDEIRAVLQLAPAQQRDYVQQQEQALATSPAIDPAQQRRLGWLRSAVTQNLAQLRDSPLLFSARQTGRQWQALDLASLQQAGSHGAMLEKVQQEMAARLTQIRALQQQNGAAVQMHPLLPQEAAMLDAVLAKADPQQQRQAFSLLFQASNGDLDAYTGALHQVAAQAPVRALLGQIAGQQEQQAARGGPAQPDIAAIGLRGQALLDKAAGQKHAETQLPPEAAFKTSFDALAGAAFAGDAAAQLVGMRAVRAYYVGQAAQDGEPAAQLQPARLQQAVTAVLGQPVNFNGSTVFAPRGMNAATFVERVHAALLGTLQAAGHDPAEALGVQLVPAGAGMYYLSDGLGQLHDAGGRLLTVTVGAAP